MKAFWLKMNGWQTSGSMGGEVRRGARDILNVRIWRTMRRYRDEWKAMNEEAMVWTSI